MLQFCSQCLPTFRTDVDSRRAHGSTNESGRIAAPFDQRIAETIAQLLQRCQAALYGDHSLPVSITGEAFQLKLRAG